MSDWKSRTGSSKGVYKRNGEIMALPHPVKKSEADLNAANAARVSAESTARAAYKDPNLKAALTAYHPNAIRNRLPVHFHGEAKPHRRFCQVRNEHTYDFFDQGTGAGFVRFRTSSQNFFDYDTNSLSVGESNQGIVSEKSKWIHSQQEK